VLYPLVFVTAALAGFVLSRAARRPAAAARAGSVVRNVSAGLGGRRGLTPPELQRACFSEMMRHVQVGRSGRGSVPSRFVLHLHPDDVAIVDANRRWFLGGLTTALAEAAADHGGSLDGDASVSVQADPSRRPGVPTASVAEPTRRIRRGSGPEPATRLAVLRSDTGEEVPLTGRSVTIGRSRDRDIAVDDPRVSRAHARFEPRGGGWVVVDERSANGTRVDGREVEPRAATPVAHGTVVSVGPVDLRVRATAEGAGTRALADSDRHRISREFLPPTGGR